MTEGAVPVYAVMRADFTLPATGVDQERALDGPLGFRVVIKEVLPTIAEAIAEVKRLNDLNGDQHCVYFWQGTRWFPDGRSGDR
jgi:hypothetical protein